MKRKTNYIITGLMLIFILVTSGCKKWTTVPAPTNSVNAGNVYTNDATAIGVLSNLYAEIAGGTLNGATLTAMPENCGLAGDEFVLNHATTDPALILEYKNTQTNQITEDIWTQTYPWIFQANAAIEGLTKSASLTPAVKQQLLGEAKFMRAFYYLNLVNIYGAIPIITSTDPNINATIPRNTVDDVYTQIINDLTAAQGLLSKNFVDGTVIATSQERARPSYWAATALLARVYLYHKDYSKAIDASSILINNTSLFKLSSLDSAFLRAGLGNKEAIFQLQPVTDFVGAAEGGFVLPSGTLPKQCVYFTNNLLNAFEPGDQRKIHWVGIDTVAGQYYYFPYKYKILSTSSTSATIAEYSMVLRLGEQYLIRAEAYAQLGKLTGANGAIADLNAIRIRAGLPAYTGSTTDNQAVLTAVLHERQVELFAEWGHRWFDMIRTGTVNSVMGGNAEVSGGVTAQKGGTWQPTDALFPLSVTVLKANPALTQNPGY